MAEALLTYCVVHERGYMPAGHDPCRHAFVPGHWRPLSRGLLALVGAVLRWGNCTLPEVTLKTCDLCRKEADASDSGPDRCTN